MDTFPRSPRSRPGYDVDAVDVFLARARAAYDGGPDESDLTAEQIRTTAFGMKRGGYSPRAIDAALERLEDAFAGRERATAPRADDSAPNRPAVAETADILERLGRSVGARFTRTGWLVQGYRIAEVDAFADRLQHYFDDGEGLDLEGVRTVTFAAQQNGYLESQVDLFIDAVTEMILAVR